jgi:hypothetical protein
VIDLRTLLPWDRETVLGSVRKEEVFSPRARLVPALRELLVY